jgi:maltooligosyltrehalose trehalohydrolase
MARFEVWAPAAARVEVVVAGSHRPMRESVGGWWELEVPDATHGSDYAYALDGATPLPDPRSCWQPNGVHEPSRVYDHGRFAWTDGAWYGRQLAGGVVYELHVGTFTAEGTFDAATAHLDHVVDLGITHVEVMPVASFPGRHGWGYDVVDLFAVHEPYGGPDGLKRFVDACHGRGLAVVLDVVYNHLGPSGNYLARFAQYLTEHRPTPWGAAVNLDDHGSDEVRRFLLDNAVMWLDDFHVDGLRLDAVHALRDDRATHFLEELAAEVDALAAAVGRPLFLVAECDRNDPRTVTAREAGGYGLTAQWNDDFHHALHTLLTGERHGYYGDFGSLSCLAKTLTKVFFHDGTWSSFRGRHHGCPVDTARLPAYRFLGYLQNHDQIGNRAAGDRISASLSPGLLKLATALLLTAPYTPLLFMGEEWAASTPWQFFTDHPEPELAETVREGRLQEFDRHGWEPKDVPDPQDPATVQRSRLDWAEPRRQPHADVLTWYRSLIALRRARPELTDPRLDRVAVDYDVEARWLVVHRGRLRVACNLADSAQQVPLRATGGNLLLGSDESVRLGGTDIELPAESVAIVEVTD